MHRNGAASDRRDENASQHADNRSHRQIIDQHMRLPAQITEAGLRVAAAHVAARQGAARATIAEIAKEAKVPTGSIYHRVPSRAALLAEVWLEAAERFSTMFMSRLAEARGLEEAAEAALVTPRFAREHPA